MGIVVGPLHTWDFNAWGHSTVLPCAVLSPSTAISALGGGNTCLSLPALGQEGGCACHRRVCGVEVLLGYCCDKPGELQSHGARPAVPSTSTIWHTVLGGVNTLLGSCMGSRLSMPAALG